ncbi:DNA-binding response regulator, partial [Mycobacterium tuberculosis]|nr:DNA-binding response regulator [Mycobacterium tuberculosis]
KPFSSRVVVARVKAVLRRSGALAGEASGAGAGLTFNGWRLDTTRCELYNPHQPTLIKTLRGLGYVFSADVTHSEKAA